MRIRVYGYLRVSTQNQVRDGYSLSYQEDEIKKYCEQNSFELLEIFRDEGVSGAKVDETDLIIEREGLQEMLSALEEQDIKYIIVLNTSRLWRSDMVKVLIHRELKRHGVDVKSIEQSTYSIYTHDPSDFLVNGMLELLDQYQRLEIALKLSRGRRKKAAGGEYAGGGATFGYVAGRSQKSLELNEEKAEIVRRVFALRAEHPDFSLSDIANALNTEGHRTTKDKAFGKTQIKRILDHEQFYRGIYSYGQIVADGKHPAIL